MVAGFLRTDIGEILVGHGGFVQAYPGAAAHVLVILLLPLAEILEALAAPGEDEFHAEPGQGHGGFPHVDPGVDGQNAVTRHPVFQHAAEDGHIADPGHRKLHRTTISVSEVLASSVLYTLTPAVL